MLELRSPPKPIANPSLLLKKGQNFLHPNLHKHSKNSIRSFFREEVPVLGFSHFLQVDACGTRTRDV